MVGGEWPACTIRRGGKGLWRRERGWAGVWIMGRKKPGREYLAHGPSLGKRGKLSTKSLRWEEARDIQRQEIRQRSCCAAVSSTFLRPVSTWGPARRPFGLHTNQCITTKSLTEVQLLWPPHAVPLLYFSIRSELSVVRACHLLGPSETSTLVNMWC